MQELMPLIDCGIALDKDSNILFGNTYPVLSSSSLPTRSRQSYKAAKTRFSGGDNSPTRKFRTTSKYRRGVKTSFLYRFKQIWSDLAYTSGHTYNNNNNNNNSNNKRSNQIQKHINKTNKQQRKYTTEKNPPCNKRSSDVWSYNSVRMTSYTYNK